MISMADILPFQSLKKYHPNPPSEPGWYWICSNGHWVVISIDMTSRGLMWILPKPDKPLETWWRPLDKTPAEWSIVGPFHAPPPAVDETKP